MNEYTLYPSGFLGLKRLDREDQQPVEKVERFFNIMEGRSSIVGTEYPTFAAFVVDVIDFAHNEFGQYFNDLLDLNVKEKAPYYLNEFLVDTVNYLETGQRKLSVDSWALLLNGENGIGTPDPAKRPVERAYKRLSPELRKTLFATWLQRPLGLRDLVWTLRFLFGKQN